MVSQVLLHVYGQYEKCLEKHKDKQLTLMSITEILADNEALTDVCQSIVNDFFSSKPGK